ncbi:secondary thiamine-phosphate synthase enzyme YjbQ [Thermus scotoductus]|uniref:Secondary thiamine-phosphate synthase n=1 Tax=Thermus scotoductus TaxID=37636 RepID=A0A430RA56_THESC|nr:secondary thiamine-phosphate synthase enzyme YjbQ [Thermus scotoductus]RTG95910.1 secondary thiamine-phosphate synthase [Thermus scotoductus]RTH04254.1 secondary thiamine-phosphate synthase [Thermus scotoductus]RTH20157.1 secondary thiamine-phosphate synthase [Thermus scotoductus]RTI01174.1 secondary thiamine-phosphate synthase [Thermus scotoductus]RTI22135.1 secondary thiamine-phosphate synthase [Thermus scotoductus]
MRTIQVATPREGLVNITRLVEGVLEGHTGLVYLFVPHTTCGLTVQEGADPHVAHDLLARLEELAPKLHPKDRHAEGNSHAHLKTLLTGVHLLLPAERGRLKLGRWQQVFLAEFDGPRTREVWVKLL